MLVEGTVVSLTTTLVLVVVLTTVVVVDGIVTLFLDALAKYSRSYNGSNFPPETVATSTLSGGVFEINIKNTNTPKLASSFKLLNYRHLSL